MGFNPYKWIGWTAVIPMFIAVMTGVSGISISQEIGAYIIMMSAFTAALLSYDIRR